MNNKKLDNLSSIQINIIESALNGYYHFLHRELVKIKKETTTEDKNLMYVELVESFRNNLNIISDLLGYEPKRDKEG